MSSRCLIDITELRDKSVWSNVIESDYKKGVEEECPVVGLIKEHANK